MNAPDLALRVNPGWARLPLFDRKGWRRMRFGDFADSINERVEPADAADEPYVGLEDLDPGDLHIRRWGKGSDVIGIKLRFREGDIIFGRRRAYQRKLAVAEFDGICSAHAMVVRAKPKVVLPEFLPLLMMSDHFMKRAVEISVGSLSPTINWSTLRLEEFDLPPLEQQHRACEIARASDHLLEVLGKVVESENKAADRLARDGFGAIDANKRGAGPRVGDIFKVLTGGTPPRNEPRYWEGDVPWVKTGEINYQDIYDSEEKISTAALENSAAKLIPPDAILIAMYGQGPTLGRVAHLRVEAATNQACAAICPARDMDPRYLYHYLRTQYARIRKLARGASQPNINLQIVKELVVPQVPLREQRIVAARLDAFAESEALARLHTSQTRAQLISLMNAFFA